MKALIHYVMKRIARVFDLRRSAGKASQNTRLMEMYLSQTNSKHSFVSEIKETRQRRNSKYSIHRERE